MEEEEKRRRLKSIYNGMKQRCYNVCSTAYDLYGSSGIKLSDEWRDDFESFYRDMSPTYQPGLSIDRIDPLGNYCKENCRWLTISENSGREKYRGTRPKQYGWMNKVEKSKNQRTQKRAEKLGMTVEQFYTHRAKLGYKHCYGRYIAGYKDKTYDTKN